MAHPHADLPAWEQAQELLEEAHRLTPWEEDFLTDLVDQEWKVATDRQQEILDRIRSEKT